MMENGFEENLSSFCRKHMQSFDNSEENKLEHMHIFQQYVAFLEQELDQRLSNSLPGFRMSQFRTWIEGQPTEQLGSDVLDTLLSATDFETFKQHMLSFKTERDMATLQPDVRSVGAHT
jgi:hypothetical protein